MAQCNAVPIFFPTFTLTGQVGILCSAVHSGFPKRQQNDSPQVSILYTNLFSSLHPILSLPTKSKMQRYPMPVPHPDSKILEMIIPLPL
jgi:hypothetical protein